MWNFPIHVNAGIKSIGATRYNLPLVNCAYYMVFSLKVGSVIASSIGPFIITDVFMLHLCNSQMMFVLLIAQPLREVGRLGP